VVDRIVLVGFMCSGKSTVGPRLAQRLGWAFVDFDVEIERREGRRIADIFRERGEPFFRALEGKVTDRVAERREIVLAPGGGWITQPALVRRLRPDGALVWLRVRPETVYARHRRQGSVVRPLLETERPLERIRTLLAERVPLYREVDLAVDTDERTPEEVVAEITDWLGRQTAR
jgi:shikimate kinase